MNIRPLNLDKDYELACSWWKAWKFPAVIRKSCLPPIGGVVETEDGNPIMLGFLYTTNSKFCVINWVVSDPESGGAARGKAMLKLIRYLKSRAIIEAKCELVYTMVENDALSDAFIQCGFQPTGDRMMEMIYRRDN